MAPLVEVTETLLLDEPSVLPEILTVLAPEMLPEVMVTLVKVAGLLDVIVKAPDKVPPLIVIPD
jgi:hypothetical protein